MKKDEEKRFFDGNFVMQNGTAGTRILMNQFGSSAFFLRFSSREDEDLFFFLVLLYLSIGEKRNHFKVKQKCIVRLSFAQVLTINYYLSILFWKIFSYLYYCWLLLCYLVVFNICFTFEIQIHILLFIKCILRLYLCK